MVRELLVSPWWQGPASTPQNLHGVGGGSFLFFLLPSFFPWVQLLQENVIMFVKIMALG